MGKCDWKFPEVPEEMGCPKVQKRSCHDLRPFSLAAKKTPTDIWKHTADFRWLLTMGSTAVMKPLLSSDSVLRVSATYKVCWSWTAIRARDIRDVCLCQVWSVLSQWELPSLFEVTWTLHPGWITIKETDEMWWGGHLAFRDDKWDLLATDLMHTLRLQWELG